METLYFGRVCVHLEQPHGRVSILVSVRRVILKSAEFLPEQAAYQKADPEGG